MEYTINENWVIIKDNLEINLDQWSPGNPLWITGASGDGKSTLTDQMAKKYNAEVVTSDIVLCRLRWTKEKFENGLDKITSMTNAHGITFHRDSPAMHYIFTHPNLPYGCKTSKMKTENYKIIESEMVKFYLWLIEQLSTNPRYRNNLYIIEGCDICVMDPEIMKTKPLIIMGGSRLQSFFRRTKRSYSSGDNILEAIFSQIKSSDMYRKLDDDKDNFRKSIEEEYKDMDYDMIDEEDIFYEALTKKQKDKIKRVDNLVVYALTGPAFVIGLAHWIFIRTRHSDKYKDSFSTYAGKQLYIYKTVPKAAIKVMSKQLKKKFGKKTIDKKTINELKKFANKSPEQLEKELGIKNITKEEKNQFSKVVTDVANELEKEPIKEDYEIMDYNTMLETDLIEADLEEELQEDAFLGLLLIVDIILWILIFWELGSSINDYRKRKKILKDFERKFGAKLGKQELQQIENLTADYLNKRGIRKKDGSKFTDDDMVVVRDFINYYGGLKFSSSDYTGTSNNTYIYASAEEYDLDAIMEERQDYTLNLGVRGGDSGSWDVSVFNWNNLDDTTKNVLFITGTPGSGKTKMAGIYENLIQGAVVISIDSFIHNVSLFEFYKKNKIPKSKIHPGDKFIMDYCKTNFRGPYDFMADGKEEEIYYFIQATVNQAKKQPDMLCIIEGVDIMRMGGDLKKLMKDYPVIVIKTPMTASMIQSLHRDGIKPYVTSLDTLKNWIKYNFNVNRNRNDFIRYMSESVADEILYENAMLSTLAANFIVKAMDANHKSKEDHKNDKEKKSFSEYMADENAEEYKFYNDMKKNIIHKLGKNLNKETLDDIDKYFELDSTWGDKAHHGTVTKEDRAAVKAAWKKVKSDIKAEIFGKKKTNEAFFLGEATIQPYKSYPNTFIYSKMDSNGSSTEQHLLNYIMKAERINKNSEAFHSIQNDIKTRQTSAVLYRVMMRDDVILAMSDKELPASFKVFRAADVRAANKEPKIFIDVTGLFKLNSGYFACKEIDKLCTYLTAALVHMLYFNSGRELTTNATVTRLSTLCFVKMFTGVLDNLRVLGYAENQNKIKYVVAVYYLYSLVGKDIRTAKTMAANILGIQQKEANAYDYYYDEENLNNIDSFVTALADTFKLKEFTTDIMIDRWVFMYGKGTMYGLELYPVYLTILTNAYCGAYVNNQKTIEKFCGKDMVTISTTILRMGADVYQEGAYYKRNEYGDIVLE